MAKLRGISVKYRYPVIIEDTIHTEAKNLLSDYIDMDIIFNENPRANTLRALGWVSENPDDKPIIAQLPYDAPNISVDCVLTLSPVDSVGRSREFKITSINTLFEFPDCWTCTLVPIFDTANNVSSDYEETDYNYLKTDQTPYVESPGNRKNQNFEFIDSDLVEKREIRNDNGDTDNRKRQRRDPVDGELL